MMGLTTAAFAVFAFFLLGTASAGNLKPRIIGGQVAQIENHPYQASIRVYNIHLCGGSIISEKHILTAAHCINQYVVPPYVNVRVHTGTSSSKAVGKMHRIASVKRHSGFLGELDQTKKHDIALITLLDPIKFDNTQKKINLPTSDVQGGESAVLSGWGSLQWKGPTPEQLRKTPMKVLSTGQCSQSFGWPLFQGQLCANLRYGVGACSGDSGGPLAVSNTLIGITSWVVPTCGTGQPDAYTRVYFYLDWIKEAMGKTSSTENEDVGDEDNDNVVTPAPPIVEYWPPTVPGQNHPGFTLPPSRPYPQYPPLVLPQYPQQYPPPVQPQYPAPLGPFYPLPNFPFPLNPYVPLDPFGNPIVFTDKKPNSAFKVDDSKSEAAVKDNKA